MSAPMPQTRNEMIRAVCEANGVNSCTCISEGIEPCLPQAGFADDVLRWIAEARKQGRAAAREMLMLMLRTAMNKWLE